MTNYVANSALRRVSIRSWPGLILGICLVSNLLAESLHAAQATAGRGVKAVSPAKIGNYANSWAVVIGINSYQKAPRLNYAVADARSMLAAILDLGFAPDKTIAILDQEATKQRLEQVLYSMLRKTTPEDRVLVFFAGHGITTALPRGGEEGYLLPVDGDPDDPGLTAIAMEDLRRIAKRIPAKHILFAVDACYSGFAITRDVPPTRVDTVYLEAMTKEPAVQIITAGRKGEPVLEEDGHGLFTRRLIQGLGGLADVDQNGVITGQELATWLESRVIRDSNNRQHPQYSRLDGEGQFVFLVPRPDEPIAAKTANAIDDRLKNLAEEVERLRRTNAALEEEHKLQRERDALLAEKAKLEKSHQEALAKTKSQPVRLMALNIVSAKRDLAVNEVLSLGLRARFSDEQEKDISEGVEWKSSATNVAAVDSRGRVQPRQAGKTEITARYGGVVSAALTLTIAQGGKSGSVKTIDSADSRKQIERARLLSEQGNYAAAIGELERALAVNPSSQEVLNEIERTKRACAAEKSLGQRTDC